MGNAAGICNLISTSSINYHWKKRQYALLSFSLFLINDRYFARTNPSNYHGRFLVMQLFKFIDVFSVLTRICTVCYKVDSSLTSNIKLPVICIDFWTTLKKTSTRKKHNFCDEKNTTALLASCLTSNCAELAKIFFGGNAKTIRETCDFCFMSLTSRGCENRSRKSRQRLRQRRWVRPAAAPSSTPTIFLSATDNTMFQYSIVGKKAVVTTAGTN